MFLSRVSPSISKSQKLPSCPTENDVARPQEEDEESCKSGDEEEKKKKNSGRSIVSEDVKQQRDMVDRLLDIMLH